MVRCLTALAAMEAHVRPRRSGAIGSKSWVPWMQDLCIPVERYAATHFGNTQQGRAFQRETLCHRHMLRQLQYLHMFMTCIGRHLQMEGDPQVTPRHTLVWGTEVDLGRAWGDPACSMPATASHPKAPALSMRCTGRTQMHAR